MAPTNLRTELRDLFHTQRLAVLSTFGDGQPYCSLVAFAATEDLGALLFATTKGTRKYTNLLSQPRVSLLVDDRSNTVADFHSACAVTATGHAEEPGAHERRRLLAVYLDKHPYLEDFVAGPSSVLLRMAVQDYVRVRQFQDVEVWHLEPWLS